MIGVESGRAEGSGGAGSTGTARILGDAVVLCGGLSRRMGSDKAEQRLGRTSLLERAVDLLSEVAPRVLLACGPTPRYGSLGLERVLDRVPDGGPLAGLEAALEASHSGWLVVLACDMPRVDAELLRMLHERVEARGLDACLFESEAGLEPLCGVYSRACLPAVRRALAAGERKMTSFHAELRIGTLREDELPPSLRALGLARNLNTASELREEQERFA